MTETEEQCEMIAMVSYTWPGREMEYACLVHSVALWNVANAMGFFLAMKQLTPEEMVQHKCSQKKGVAREGDITFRV